MSFNELCANLTVKSFDLLSALTGKLHLVTGDECCRVLSLTYKDKEVKDMAREIIMLYGPIPILSKNRKEAFAHSLRFGMFMEKKTKEIVMRQRIKDMLPIEEG